MTRLLRDRAGRLLAAFLVLDVAIWVYTATAGSRLNAGTEVNPQQFLWTAVGLFLVWRVWRGSRIAWALLLGINLLVVAELFFGLGRLSVYVSGLWVCIVAQLVVLLAPAIRHHLSRTQPVS